MFHLANKVYVDSIERIRFNTDIIVVSDMGATEYGYNTELSEYVSGEPHVMVGWANSLEELMKKEFKNKNFVEFIKSYEGSRGDGKLIIYADKRNYRKIVIKWLRTILPNLKSDSCQLLFKYYRDFRKYYSYRDNHYNVADHNQANNYYDYWETSDDFSSEYLDSTPFEYSGTNLFASIEYLVASHFYKPSDSEIAKSLAEKLEVLYKQYFLYCLKKNKLEIEKRIYEFHRFFPDKFGSDELASDLEADEVISRFPEYSFLGDEGFGTLSLEELEEKYSILDVVNAILEFDAKEVKEAYGLTSTDIITDQNVTLKLYSEKKRQLNQAEIMEKELESFYGQHAFKSIVVSAKCNNYLLSALYDNKSKPEKLKAFSLVE